MLTCRTLFWASWVRGMEMADGGRKMGSSAPNWHMDALRNGRHEEWA